MGVSRRIFDEISARGIGYFWAENKEDFIRGCMMYNVDFLLPTINNWGDNWKYNSHTLSCQAHTFSID
jgi:hypothetical protein